MGTKGPSTPEASESLDTLRSLVVSAFEAAKKSGHPDWQSMTFGVLKNRILQATAREFDERQYGATSFSEVLRLIPDVVELDEDSRPARAKLLELAADLPTEDRQGNSPSIVTHRFRPDLWDAVLDYSWEGAYVWDGRRAVRVEHDEVGDKPRLPTISPEEMANWRRDFASDHPDRQLDEWANRGLGTSALPADLRGPWNQLVKSNALKILKEWFDEQGIDPPGDTLISTVRERVPADNSEAEELRRFLLRCIAVMKPAELRGMQVPASVAVRVRS